MKKLLILTSLLIILNGCTSRYLPTVVTEYLPSVKQEIPAELLEAEPVPSADVLKNVEISKGKEELITYGMALLHANYINTQKLEAIKELLQ